MPRPWRIRFAGAKYHVTVRGNAREAIFHAPEDYVRFLKQLASAFGLPVEALQGHGRRVGIAKQVAAELAALHSGLSQREVGRALGYRGNGAGGMQRE